MFRQVLSNLALAFSPLAATLLITTGGVPAAANQPSFDNSLEAHGELLQAVVNNGVRVYINPAHCGLEDFKGVAGFYVSQARIFVVCQDKGNADSIVVEWTDNDLDTIRHEAQHMVQDCKDGLGDNSLVNFFPLEENEEGLITLQQFSSGVLSLDEIGSIYSTYTSRGADMQTVLLEIEAFAVARAVPASSITAALNNVCALSDAN